MYTNPSSDFEQDTGSPSSFEFSPLLDDGFLRNHYGEDISDAAFAFDLFLTVTMQTYREFESVVTNAGCTDSLRTLAHRLCPSFRLVGLTDLADRLRDIQHDSANYACLFKAAERITEEFAEMLPVVEKQREEIFKNINGLS